MSGVTSFWSGFIIVLAFVVAGKQIALQKRRESEAAEDPAVAATEGQPS